MIINAVIYLSLALGLVSFSVTPLLLFKIFSDSIFFEKNLSKVIAIAISLILHFLFSIFVFLLAIFIFVGPDPRPNQVVPLGSKIVIVVLFIIYVFIEWIVCSILVKKPLNPFYLIFNKETPLSINDKV
jgi:hypothetical protein